ncbi:MAG: Nif3-like dinuclear metal center hexameric protein, partial [bacterium]|nr:Nif3-like dinuclear metal center hexameric protein [Candidatus Kapabacteria bacterium]
MRVSEFIDAFGRTLPLALALADDPVGIQIKIGDVEISGVAVAYELDEDAVRRAAHAGANLIIAFHPLIYSPLRRITGDGRVERTVIELIDRRIALYVVHTAFDAHPRGTSVLLGEAIGLVDIEPIVRDATHTESGMGAVGNLLEPIPLAELAERVRIACGAAVVRVSEAPGGSLDRSVDRVAIVGGSGMSYYDRAVDAGANAFISADVRYHAFHSAADHIPVLDPGHAESEAFVVDGIVDLVRKTVELSGLAIDVIPLSESTNPVHYVVS